MSPKLFCWCVFWGLLLGVLSDGGRRGTGVHASIGDLAENEVTETYSVVGGRGFLPCNISSPESKDLPLLILFFKDQEPIYSIDARDGSLQKAIHWTTPLLNSRRPNFVISDEPNGLVIPSVEADDEGNYHCRVDFVSSPTRNLQIKLHVAVAPSRIRIMDERGIQVHGLIGPFPLGDALTLTCVAMGGRPKPKITWWHDKNLLDDLMEESKSHITTNSVTLPNLSKSHLGWKLTCQAVNSNLTNPVETSVQIDMKFPPFEISIEGAVRPVREGQSHRMSCSTSGSRPSANITWWKDGQYLGDVQETNQNVGNVTRSTISILPTKNDDQSVIACRAENPLMLGSAIEDTRKLIVFYPPQIQLLPGRNLVMEDIEEGDDVYFDCVVGSNPQVFRIEWMLDNRPLQHKISKGIILSNRTLVLQKVSRSLAGSYRCKASNSIGKATSNSLYLSIKYSPYCQPDQQTLYGSGSRNAVNVSCEVGGWPLPNKFFWSLNTSSDFVDLSTDIARSNLGNSILLYKPKSFSDFGTLFCWGENELGRQLEPCTFQVVPAAPPEELRNCSVSQNRTNDEGTIAVHCIPGWDGGLPQRFSLEVRKLATGPILARLKGQANPTFTVTGLPSGRDFHLKVIAENDQGTSSPLDFHYFSPIDIAEERLSAATSAAAGWGSKYVEGIHLIGVAVGVAVVLTISCGVLVAIVRTRAASHARQPMAKPVNPESSSEGRRDEGGFVHETGPDILLVTADGKSGQEEIKELPKSGGAGQKCSIISSLQPGLDENKVHFKETDVLLPTEEVDDSSSLITISTSSYNASKSSALAFRNLKQTTPINEALLHHASDITNSFPSKQDANSTDVFRNLTTHAGNQNRENSSIISPPSKNNLLSGDAAENGKRYTDIISTRLLKDRESIV